MTYAQPGCTYWVRCKGCTHAKDYGAARLRAELEAGKHARKHGSHQVQVQEVRVLHTFTGLDNMQALPDVDSPPY